MRSIKASWLTAVAWAAASTAAIAEPEPTTLQPAAQAEFEFRETYALGVVEHELDTDTELTGWRMGGSWFVGHESREGDDDPVALVWQRERVRVSFSTEGIRYTRRF